MDRGINATCEVILLPVVRLPVDVQRVVSAEFAFVRKREGGEMW
jgi:hypothetical protein